MAGRFFRRGAWAIVRRLVVIAFGAIIVFLVVCVLGLFVLRAIDPPVTMVQAQRSIEARISGEPYSRRYSWVPASRISPHLLHAVVAAEDTRYYLHHGVDWDEIEKMLDEEVPRGRIRGASTITQQLVKNLFMTTHPFPARKPVEFLLAPVADRLLGKSRVLELYVNVVEWGPGVFGAEAAARYHYRVAASDLTRAQSARLAACLPSPRRWRPERMDKYSAIILNRMDRMGW